MIILRNMGTLHYGQAMLPELDIHDANDNSINKSATSDRRKLDGTPDDDSLACLAGTSRVDFCGSDLARGWWSGAHRVSLRCQSRWRPDSSLPDSDTAYRKMGPSKASGIDGQPGAPHPNTNALNNWPCHHVPEPRPASSGSPRCHGTDFSHNTAAFENALQNLASPQTCLKKRGTHA